MRDENYSVSFKVTDPDPEVIVFDLEADPEEDHPLQDPPIEVVNTARHRAEELLGRLSVRFRQYDQRHTACSMRSFAPSRLDRDRG